METPPFDAEEASGGVNLDPAPWVPGEPSEPPPAQRRRRRRGPRPRRGGDGTAAQRLPRGPRRRPTRETIARIGVAVPWIVFAIVIVVLGATFLTDTAAYAGGRLFGRHPLAPRISPNKTIEGLAFGFVGGTAGFWFAGLYQDWLPGIDALIMGMCIAIVAPMGDLFESMLKRDLDVKDTGNVFGPHGGLLDRLDALLFTIVVGYYLAVAFLY